MPDALHSAPSESLLRTIERLLDGDAGDPDYTNCSVLNNDDRECARCIAEIQVGRR